MSTTTIGTPDKAPGTVPSQTRADSTSVWKAIGRNAGARMIALPISAILGIVNTRLIITHFGANAYAQYGLLVGIGSLLPFADLGVSAALVNAVSEAENPARSERVCRTLVSAVRVLAASASVILAITVTLTLGGWWRTIFGSALLPHSGPIAAALCLAMIAITMPAGFGDRILTGLNKNYVSIIVQSVQTPLVLLALILVIEFDNGGGGYVGVLPYVIAFATTLVSCWVAARHLRPTVGWALRNARRIRTVKGGKVFDIAWPMFVQMLALPIAMQTDRLILSHVSTLQNLAEYNLASQMYGPVWTVVGSAGIALWPIFAKQRASATSRPTSPIPLALIFGVSALAIAGIISLAAGWLSDRASGGLVHLSLGLMLSFVALTVCQALKFPLGMYMTDPRGMRYQAVMVVLLVPVNLGISLYLAHRLGAAGPVIGSAASVFVFQVVANWVYVRRDLTRRMTAHADVERDQSVALQVSPD